MLGTEGGITPIPGPGRRVGPSGRITAPWWSREVVQAARDSPRPNESVSMRPRWPVGLESLAPSDDYSVSCISPFRSVSMIYSRCSQLLVLSRELLNIGLNEGIMQAEPECTFSCGVVAS